MRLMYVFDPRESQGYLFRAPELIARWFCKLHSAQARKDSRVVGSYDYAPTPEGY